MSKSPVLSVSFFPSAALSLAVLPIIHSSFDIGFLLSNWSKTPLDSVPSPLKPLSAPPSLSRPLSLRPTQTSPSTPPTSSLFIIFVSLIIVALAAFITVLAPLRRSERLKGKFGPGAPPPDDTPPPPGDDPVQEGDSTDGYPLDDEDPPDSEDPDDPPPPPPAGDLDERPFASTVLDWLLAMILLVLSGGRLCQRLFTRLRRLNCPRRVAQFAPLADNETPVSLPASEGVRQLSSITSLPVARPYGTVAILFLASVSSSHFGPDMTLGALYLFVFAEILLCYLWDLASRRYGQSQYKKRKQGQSIETGKDGSTMLSTTFGEAPDELCTDDSTEEVKVLEYLTGKEQSNLIHLLLQTDPAVCKALPVTPVKQADYDFSHSITGKGKGTTNRGPLTPLNKHAPVFTPCTSRTPAFLTPLPWPTDPIIISTSTPRDSRKLAVPTPLLSPTVLTPHKSRTPAVLTPSPSPHLHSSVHLNPASYNGSPTTPSPRSSFRRSTEFQCLVPDPETPFVSRPEAEAPRFWAPRPVGTTAVVLDVPRHYEHLFPLAWRKQAGSVTAPPVGTADKDWSTEL